MQMTQAPSRHATLVARSPREQQAVEQLAVTTFSRGVPATLIIAFLALISVIPVYETAQEVVTRGRTRERLMREGVPKEQWPRRRPLIGTLLEELPIPDPASLRALEDELLLTSAAGSLLRPATQSLLSRLGVGNRSVVWGRDGILHYIDGVNYVIGPGFLEADPLSRAAVSGRTGDPRPAILQLHRELKAVGVDLLVLPLPDKAVIMPGTLARDLVGRSGLQNRSWQAFVGELEQAGVHLLDVTRPMADAELAGHRQFIRRDSHWSPAGIDVTARAVATRLARDFGIATGSPRRYSRRRVPIERDRADLVDLLGLPHAQASRLAYEQLALDRVEDASGGPWQPTRGSDILLIGDSFSEVLSSVWNGSTQSAGFAEQISYYLQRPIDARASHVFGALDVRELLGKSLDEVRRTVAGRRVVIWEFAVRKLAISDWSLVP